VDVHEEKALLSQKSIKILVEDLCPFSTFTRYCIVGKLGGEKVWRIYSF